MARFRDFRFPAQTLTGISHFEPLACGLVTFAQECVQNDLKAAHRTGLKTAFVPRPLEFGPGGNADVVADEEFDLVAKDFTDLAVKLGA